MHRSECPLITPYPIDDRLRELWDAVDSDDPDFRNAVVGSVQYVTLQGFAHVTGACALQVAEIARRIVTGLCYPIPATPWGGRTRDDHGEVTHILPPANRETQKMLRDALKRIDAKGCFTFSDTAPAFVNIVGVTMRRLVRGDR